MMVFFHRNFEKQYQKLRPGEQNRCQERLALFSTDPFHPLLHNHPLQGIYTGRRSINIGGDLRAIYRLTTEDSALFMDIDTHDKLYS